MHKLSKHRYKIGKINFKKASKKEYMLKNILKTNWETCKETLVGEKISCNPLFYELSHYNKTNKENTKRSDKWKKLILNLKKLRFILNIDNICSN